jgi:hypothetical protein
VGITLSSNVWVGAVSHKTGLNVLDVPTHLGVQHRYDMDNSTGCAGDLRDRYSAVAAIIEFQFAIVVDRIVVITKMRNLTRANRPAL